MKGRAFPRFGLPGLWSACVLIAVFAGCTQSKSESAGDADATGAETQEAAKTGVQSDVALNQAANRLIVEKWLGGGGADIRSIAFSPDGKRLAVGYSTPGRDSIWQIDTRSELISLDQGDDLAVEGTAFSQDGRLIAVGVEDFSSPSAPGEIRIRDARTGALIRTLQPAPTKLLSFGPDGTFLIAGSKVFGIPEGKSVRRLSLPDKFLPWGQDLSPDGTLIALSGHIDGTHAHPSPIACIFEAKTGRLVKSLECPIPGEHSGCLPARGCDFHPDGKTLVIGTVIDEFCVANIETGKTTVVQREGGRWWAVCFHPSGDLVAASGAGGTILIWDHTKELCALKGHLGSVYALQFSPKGDLLASGGMDGIVRLWGPKGNGSKEWELVGTLPPKQP